MISTAYASTGAAEPFYYDPTFVVALAFVITFVLFGKKMWAAISGALDDRSEQIRASIEEATQLREEAQAKLAEFERKQHEALKEAETIVSRAKDEAARLTVEAAEKLEVSLKRSEQMAKDRIAQAEAQAIAEVRALAVDVAIGATEKLLSDGMTAKKSDAVINEAIKDLGAKLN